MDRRAFCLIVNPNAGRGRAARLLPRVEQALRARGLGFRVERTDSLAHARELARGTLAADEVAAAMGGDGLLGAVAGELRGTGGVLGVLPGGRGNDFARKLGIGSDPEHACDVLAAGRRRLVDVAEAGGRTYLGIASAGLDSDVQDIANRTRLPLGRLVYAYATLRALRGWRHARWQVVVDGAAQAFEGYSVAVANSGVFGGGMYLVPDASLDDGMLDVVLTRAAAKWSYLAGLPKVFRGTHTDNPDLTFVRGREISFHADRPFAAYADGDPIADLPVTITVVPRALEVLVPLMLLGPKVGAAKAVGAIVRAARRGGGTSLPGKLLTRLEPHAIALLAQRLRHRSAVISATNGKTTTAAMAASILELSGETLVHNRAGANMAGGVASALVSAARRGGRELDGELGLFEVDEFWLGPVVAELRPRAVLLGNLFRDQLDRYGELEIIAARWAEVVAAHAGVALVLNADDPLIGDLGREREALFFGVDDDSLAIAELQHAADSKHCRRCGHPYVYEAIYMAHLGRYACPNCGARRPEPAVVARDVELRGIRSAAFTLVTPAGSERVELPLPGLYNVYNALGAAALCLALGAPLEALVAGLQAVAPAFGRAETVMLGDRPTSILLVKNPAGANEVLRMLALEGEQLDLFGVLNDNTADGRDISWVWDADWELLVPAVRQMTCSGTRAAELALRLKYAGVEPGRLRVVPELAEGLDAALADGDGPLYALPTYTALLELRDLLARRGQVQGHWR